MKSQAMKTGKRQFKSIRELSDTLGIAHSTVVRKRKQGWSSDRIYEHYRYRGPRGWGWK